jgi:hypothetical protein
LTKEQRAAQLTTEAQNKAYQQQESATAMLAHEVEVLTEAYRQAAVAAKQYFAATQPNSASGLPAGTMYTAPTQTLKGGYQMSSQEQTYYGQTSNRNAAGQFQSQAARLDAARNAMAKDYMASMNVVSRDATDIQKKTAAQTRVQETVNKKLSGANIMMGAMGISMAAMMVSSNKTVDSLAKWTMIGALAAPALKASAGFAKDIVLATKEAAVAQLALNAGTAAEAGIMGTATAAARGFGIALNEALGPIGWIALGLTAIAGVFLAIKHHQDDAEKTQREIVDAQVKANDALNNSSASIATNLGKAAGYYKQIAGANGTSASSGQGALLGRYNYYKGDGKSELQGFVDQSTGSLMSGDALMDKARQKFIDLQVLGKDSAKQARTDLQAMLLAAGTSATEAGNMADSVYKKYGDISKLDWSKPLKDQASALARLGSQYNLIDTTPGHSYGGRGGVYSVVAAQYEIDPSVQKLIEQQATKASQIFNQALALAKTPADQKKIIDQFMRTALQQWQAGFQRLKGQTGTGFDAINQIFTQYGVTSGKSFSKAWETNANFKKAITDLSKNPANRAALNEFTKAVFAGQAWEKTIIQPMSKDSNRLADSIWNVVGALKGFNEQGIGVGANKAAKNLMGGTDYTTLIRAQKTLNELRSKGQAGSAAYLGQLNQLNRANKSVMQSANDLNKRYGFAQGQTGAEALYNLLNHVKAQTDAANNSAKDYSKTLDGLPSRVTTTISLKQIPGLVHDSMSAVQDDMATSAENAFQARWDARMNAAQAAQASAENALQNRQQAAQDAMDKRFQQRQDAITAAYQKRIDMVQKEIDAEQKADDARQRIFEAEKARLSQMAELQNNQIDFNQAVTEGRLDDAAKTQNDMGASQANNEMDREEAAAQARSQRRIDLLNKKNDRLEKQRDKELKQLQKMEDQQKKHLERMQQAQTAALQKRSAADMAALNKQKDYDQAILEQRLDLFKSYIGKNQRDLESWMKQVGLTYDDFGTDVKAKGESWSKYFQTSLQNHIRQAGMQILSDNMWEKIGAGMADKLLKGIGFKNKGAFLKFLNTGQMKQEQRGQPGGDVQHHPVKTHHAGGEIGRAPSSRGNIPNTYKGLHRSEQMVRAQKGEYIINKESAKKNMALLERVNSGMIDRDARGSAGTYAPVAGFMSGVIGDMFKSGVGKGIRGVAKNARRGSPSIGPGMPTNGTYVPGPGGRHRPIGAFPIVQGLHDQSTGYPAVDIAAPIGSPVYAVSDGTVTRSYDIRGYEPRRRVFGQNSQDGFRSYGRVMYLKTNSGSTALYAHLSKRSVAAGQHVRGGSVIGYSGNTGNVQSSSGNGAHLHFGSAPASPYAWLRKGGTIKYDNTPAVLHKKERVLSAPLSEKLDKGLNKLASGVGDRYDITLDLRGAYIKEDVDIEKAVDRALAKKEAKLGRKRVVTNG